MKQPGECHPCRSVRRTARVGRPGSGPAPAATRRRSATPLRSGPRRVAPAAYAAFPRTGRGTARRESRWSSPSTCRRRRGAPVLRIEVARRIAGGQVADDGVGLPEDEASSSITGTRPFGFIARNAGSSTRPNAPPASTVRYSRPASSAHHSALRTLLEFFRPQMVNILCVPSSVDAADGSPERPDDMPHPTEDGPKKEDAPADGDYRRPSSCPASAWKSPSRASGRPENRCG